MVSMRTRWLERLERTSPRLFLLSGAVLVALLVIGQVVRFTAVSIPRTAYWPLFPLAVALALVGLVGLYPRLAEHAPRSAVVGGGFGVVGAVLLLGGLGPLLVVSPPGPYPGNLGVLGAPFFLGLLAFVPAVGIYGLLCLHAGTPCRRIGVLLLLVGVLQLGELVGAEVLFSSAGTAVPSAAYLGFEVVTYGLIATAMGGVGYTLRRDIAPAEADDPVNTPAVPADAS